MIHQVVKRVQSSIWRMLMVGRVTAPADETGPIQFVQVVKNPISGAQPKIPSYQLYGFASSPVSNSTDLIVLHANGDENHPIAIASNDGKFRPTGLNSGEVKIYDNAGNSIYFSGGTLISIEAQSAVSITTPTLTINGNVQVNGKVVATGNITGNGISLDSHVHGGVSSGGSDTTGPIG